MQSLSAGYTEQCERTEIWLFLWPALNISRSQKA